MKASLPSLVFVEVVYFQVGTISEKSAEKATVFIFIFYEVVRGLNENERFFALKSLEREKKNMEWWSEDEKQPNKLL